MLFFNFIFKETKMRMVVRLLCYYEEETQTCVYRLQKTPRMDFEVSKGEFLSKAARSIVIYDAVDEVMR